MMSYSEIIFRFDAKEDMKIIRDFVKTYLKEPIDESDSGVDLDYEKEPQIIA